MIWAAGIDSGKRCPRFSAQYLFARSSAAHGAQVPGVHDLLARLLKRSVPGSDTAANIGCSNLRLQHSFARQILEHTHGYFAPQLPAASAGCGGHLG